MTVRVEELVPSKYVESVETSQYTANNVKSIIDKCTFVNTTANNVVVNMWFVAQNASTSNSNIAIVNKTIMPHETYNAFEVINRVMAPNSRIVAQSDTSDAVNLSVSGREVSI